MNWKPESLGNLLDPSGNTRAGTNDLPVLSITMHDGLVDQAEKFKKRVASRDISGYRVVYRNELVVGFPIDEGVLGFQTKYPAAVVSPAYGIWKLKRPEGTHIPYMESYLRSDEARTIYASKMRGAVARRRSITREDFLEIEIPFPPLDEQRKIAATLEKAKTLCRQRQGSISFTDELLQSVFLQMFGDPVMNPKKLPMRLLGEFGIVQTGNTPPRSNKFNYAATGLEWIKTDNIIEDQIYVAHAAEHLSESGEKVARFAPSGSLLVACIAGSEKSIGRAALTDRPVAFNQQINSITPHAGVSPIFLYFLMKAGRRYVQMAAGNGMKKIINKSTFEAIRFISPSEEDQQRFELIAQKLLSHGQNCREQSFHLEKLFSSIQQRSFRGELDLSRLTLVDEVDSPVATIVPDNPAIQGRFKHPGSFIAPPDIEAQMMALEDRLDTRPGDSIPWSEDFFKYRILSQVLTPPFSFNEVWEAVRYDMEDADYEDVKAKIFGYIEAGILEQQFDMDRKEIVFYPRP
jgi:type I restriction enzyme, S subunit